MAKDVLSFLPYLGWKKCDMFQSHYLQTHLFKIGLADSSICPLCKSVPLTEEHLSDCPAILHVLLQDNCGVPLPARATSALYWTARRLMSENM
ncbi:hypothetical protein TNCV_2560741 [Trichonephila clavipes]|uniref:Uncharacterized protein n=1 Tax=Trichonephila clavipes TaxID=2585209 RepID=A0A8X6UW03_TRICX|nr:hypothetical protein TNCV_2560741 [Trichonephila clavipes]